jgi:hypothetical protein
MKMVELTQTRLASFYNGTLGASWWYWFKHHHLEFNIKQVERLEVYKAHGLTNSACQTFYTNLCYTLSIITTQITFGILMILEFKKESKAKLGC